MTTYVLEIRSTQDWSDCRYRSYTNSLRRAEEFEKFPKINFTDSGHGLVPTVTTHPYREKRKPEIRMLAPEVNAFFRSHKPKPRTQLPKDDGWAQHWDRDIE